MTGSASPSSAGRFAAGAPGLGLGGLQHAADRCPSRPSARRQRQVDGLGIDPNRVVADERIGGSALAAQVEAVAAQPIGRVAALGDQRAILEADPASEPRFVEPAGRRD